MAKARLDVLQAVELVGRRAQALGQQLEALHAQRQLAAPRAEGDAVDADDVAEVEVEQARHRLLAEHVDAGLQLDAPRAVVEVEEGHLALAAAGVQAPGDAVVRLGVLAGGQVGVRGVDRADRRHARDRRAGTGSMPSARRRSSFARRVARSSEPSSSAIAALRDVDLGDLELALLAAGQGHVDRVAALVPEQRLADRRLVGEPLLRRASPRPSRRSCTCRCRRSSRP